MAKKKKRSVMPIYAVAATWAIYAMSNPLYKLSHFIWPAILSFIVYSIAQGIWKPKWVEEPEKPVEIPAPPPPPEPEKKGTGDPELDAFILEGERAVAEMNRLNDNIADPDISRRITRLTELTRKIFSHVTASPKKLSRARKFVNYYLPTTIKLLNAYDRMGEQGIEGENIGGTMRKIEDMLDTVVTAFERQLDNLFSEEALDISADITVMEGMIQREGLNNSAEL